MVELEESMKRMEITTIRLTEEQKSSLKAISIEEGLSLSEVFRTALSAFIETYKAVKERELKIVQ